MITKLNDCIFVFCAHIFLMRRHVAQVYLVSLILTQYKGPSLRHLPILNINAIAVGMASAVSVDVATHHSACMGVVSWSVIAMTILNLGFVLFGHL